MVWGIYIHLNGYNPKNQPIFSLQTYPTFNTSHTMVREKPDNKTAKTPDSRMPSVWIKVEVKEALWDLAEKGESYSEVIARIIYFYKSKHK